MQGGSYWAQPSKPGPGAEPGCGSQRALGKPRVHRPRARWGGQVEISCGKAGAEASGSVENLSTPPPCASEMDTEWSGKQRCWRPSVA